MSKVKIHYEVVPLDDVMRYFVKGYGGGPGTIENHEYFVDAAKGQVVIKLYVAGGSRTPE